MRSSLDIGKLVKDDCARGLNVMILFPSLIDVIKMRDAFIGPSIVPQPSNLFLRNSDDEFALKSVPLDVLIVVNRHDCNFHGIEIARGKLCTSSRPIYIEIRAHLT
jgi:hypothetical protein